MAWRRIGVKPLSEPALNRFTDAYMVGDELNCKCGTPLYVKERNNAAQVDKVNRPYDTVYYQRDVIHLYDITMAYKGVLNGPKLTKDTPYPALMG